MRFKRLLSTALAAALTVGLLSLPASAASFNDLGSQPQVAEAAEFLRLMGVVNGVPGGGFNPDGTLSRAEFCAMAIRVLDRTDEEPAQRSRTIYLDVGPTFWATGYINLASIITLDGDGATPLVAGVGDGTFQPNRAITFGEAVTILCRILKYSGSDLSAGTAWYDGYLSAGAAAGLTSGLSLSGTDVITRGQAAILFYNLYFSKSKGSDKIYLISDRGGSETDYSVLLDVDATADDGTTGAVKTTAGTYKTDRSLDPALVGREGKALLSADEKLLVFVPREGATQRVVNVTGTQATYLMASGGEKITVEPETVVYLEGKATTWEAAYQKIHSAAPVPVTFHYGANGKLSYLFFSSDTGDAASSTMVARSVPSGSNPFSVMAGGGAYTMYKNGMAATATDIRQYDVATFDPGTRVIQVSDLKLTGVYEDASPSPAAPITIKVMGKDDFKVLPSARDDLEAFRPGDQITLLLTTDNQVAGVVSADVVRNDPVGIASIDGSTATVTLLQGGLTVKGEVYSGAGSRYNNQLVTVSGSAAGRLNLTAASGGVVKGDLDVASRKLAGADVTENVAIYDRVEGGIAVPLSYDDLTLTTIPRSKISFVSYDYAGRVDCLVLKDVTGDAYEYGYFYYERAKREPNYKYELDAEGNLVPVLDENGNHVIDGYTSTGSSTLCIRQGDTSGADSFTPKAIFNSSVRHDAPGGIAYNATGKIAATVTLQSLTGVNRSAFDPDEMTVTVAGVSYPVSNAVQCYNKSTKTWFSSGKEGMEAIRAYSDGLTLYYDRAPSEGGKIRLIVVP